MRVGKLKSKSLLSPAAFENSWCAADSGPLTKVFKVEKDPRLRVGSRSNILQWHLQGLPSLLVTVPRPTSLQIRDA
ncbi:hypothetical protein R1flu_013741 [Riccia fluitans]|uniref:Uncharacterized protein n=1 Tax=Riccia fluitans TaxID=41844 RepID=A0ABD1YEG7_9MARC